MQGSALQMDPAPRSGPQSEQASIRKGVLLCGLPVVVTIVLQQQRAICMLQADCPLPAGASAAIDTVIDAAIDAETAAAIDALIAAALPGMLGLRIAPESFIALAANDALLGPLVRARPGLRIVQSATVFEALTWAIIGQQINVAFAIALRRTLILQAGRQHSSGLWCYPEASDVARLNVDALTSRKFSRAKADTLLRVASLVASGELDLSMPSDQIGPQLLAIKGIGAWTVNYTLLRGYGDADCSLHGDSAIRLALQRLHGTPEKPDIASAQAILARYQPHRSMAAAHLWASLQVTSGSEQQQTQGMATRSS
jgi:DNA-3-methyladenine glycosylase II